LSDGKIGGRDRGREGRTARRRRTLSEDGQGATAGVAFLGKLLNFFDEFLFGPLNVLEGSVDGADFPADVAFPLQGRGRREGGREGWWEGENAEDVSGV